MNKAMKAMKLNNQTIEAAGNAWSVSRVNDLGVFEINFLKAMLIENIKSIDSRGDSHLILGIFPTYEEACKFRHTMIKKQLKLK